MMIQDKEFCKICKATSEEDAKLIQCKKCKATLCKKHESDKEHDCYYSAPQKKVTELKFEGETFETTFDDTAVIERLAKQTYPSEESGLRELVVNAQGHGCKVAMENGYQTKTNEDPYVRVYLDPLDRQLVVQDVGGMGMSRKLIKKVLSCVGKSGNFNSKMAGQFGMGFYAVLKLASVVIVETWSRETEERQCLMMRDGKYWKEIKQAPEDQIPDYGTKLTMTLYPEPEAANRTQKDRIAEINKMLENEDLTNDGEMILNSELTLLQNEPDAVIQKNIINVIRSISEHSGVKTEIELEHDLEKSLNEGIEVIEPIDPNDFVKLDEKYKKQEYGTIENEDYSLHFSMGEDADQDYSTSGTKGSRHLLVGVPIKTGITIPYFSSYIFNIKNERKFAPIASREELLKSSTTRLQAMVNDDLEKFFGELSVNNIEEYKTVKYQLPVKFPNKIRVSELLPMHTMAFYEMLQTECQEIRGGTRCETKLKKFVDNWDNTIIVKANNGAQIDRVMSVDYRNQIVIFSRKDGYWERKQELALHNGLQLAKEYIKKNRHRIPKGKRLASAGFEIAAHNGDSVDWVDMIDMSPAGHKDRIYVYCDSNFKDIMRDSMTHVWMIKNSKRLHQEIKEHNDDAGIFDNVENENMITKDRIMSFDQYIEVLSKTEINSSEGIVTAHDALSRRDSGGELMRNLNYYDGNLTSVKSANEKYMKLDGLVIYPKDNQYRILRYLIDHHDEVSGSYEAYSSLQKYDPMERVVENVINDTLKDSSDIVKTDAKMMIKNCNIMRVDDIHRITTRLSHFRDESTCKMIADVYGYTSKYDEKNRKIDKRREEEYFGKLETVYRVDMEYGENTETSNSLSRYNMWNNRKALLKVLKHKLQKDTEVWPLFLRIITKTESEVKYNRANFTSNDKIKLLRDTYEIDKMKTYMKRKKDSKHHKTYFVEIVFNEKISKVTSEMISRINTIMGSPKFESLKKVGHRMKLVLSA